MDQQTLHTYPCEYTFKIFGTATEQEQLSPQILTAVAEVVEVVDNGINQRCSSAGKYFCISVKAFLESEQQRRRIYTLLQQLEGVRYIL
ncbi:MAG: DUF493 domain-containing protein [Desulfuromonadaceae bacterium]|nr:DUF493 domain-containing protein [Desulfuromonadaceae bacterium]